MARQSLKNQETIRRHTPIEIAEHWLFALSGFVLLFSGFGELPMYKRFMVTQIPGLSWAGDFFIHLKIHYVAALVFLGVMVFHAIYHGMLGHRGLLPRKGDLKASLVTILSMFGMGEEPKSHKYLPEQRLAYLYIGGMGLLLVLTGLVKVIKNLPAVYLSPGFIKWMTLTHTFATLFFLLGVIAHLAALLFKVNRPLVRSIFTGQVDLEYVRERHTLWYEELISRQGIQSEVKMESEVMEEAPKPVAEAVAKEETVAPTPPDAGEETQTKMEEQTMVTQIQVKGMSCEHCVMAVKKALSALEGVEKVEVDLSTGEVRFENTKAIAIDQIKGAIEKAGYEIVS